MKKFLSFAVILAAFLALFFAGCSNSAGGGGNGDERQNDSNQVLTGGIAPGSAYEETLTIDLSAASDKLSAAGAASLAAGKDVSEWFASKAVSRSVAYGFVGFKAVIVSATETKLVIKVTGVAGIKKCSVTLSITIPAAFTASGKEVKKENVKTVGIGVALIDDSGNAEILQTDHVKVEKVAGGLKFTITRPTDDCYNPNKFFDTGDYDYTYLGQGNGDYDREGYKYVGTGKGSYKKEQEEVENYILVGSGQGDYECVCKNVGEGKGQYKKESVDTYTWVGEGNGAYGNPVYEYVGEGNGRYKKEIIDNYLPVGDGNGAYSNPTYEYVGEGNGHYRKVTQDENTYYVPFGSGQGDYECVYEYVGEGNGSYKKQTTNNYMPVVSGQGDYECVYEYVGEGNGSYKKQITNNYIPVGSGQGDYEYVYEYVGDGQGSCKKERRIEDRYKYVYPRTGDYALDFKYVGEGLGSYKKGVRGGFSNLQIASSAGMPVAYLNVWSDASAGAYECFYPLVTPGKRYEFLITIEPYDRNLMDSRYDEKISVVAGEGIGEVDFSQNNPRVDLTYDNASEKPIVIISDLNLPEGLKNPRTGVQYWATNQSELKENGDVDWLLPYAMVWCGQMIYDGLERELSKEPSSEWGDRDFKTVFDGSGKDTLYVNCYVQFDVPGTNGTTWRKPDYCALLKIR